MERQKRTLAVHDISCAGRCSLTVALPIISAAGIETVVLPTSILSTHTGGFEGYTYLDLTDEIPAILSHFAELELGFDSIYTGYLGSARQIDIMKKLFDDFGTDSTLLAVDPVMADNGKLYQGFGSDYPALMLELCKKARLIIPNITEAALLLDEPYVTGPYTEDYIRGLLERLGALGPDMVVLTGVHFGDKDLGAAVWERGRPPQGRFVASSPLIGGYYHGTGDVFGSALVSALLSGYKLLEAAEIAVDFTVNSIKLTDPKGDKRYGVRFEAALPQFIKALNRQL